MNQPSGHHKSLTIKQAILMVLLLSLSIFSLLRSVHGSSVLAASLGSVKAYPNPWRADKHANSSIKFDNLPSDATVKIFTVSAHEVKTLVSDSTGIASWDRTNEGGDHVASGIYIYLVVDPRGNSTSGKLAIIN